MAKDRYKNRRACLRTSGEAFSVGERKSRKIEIQEIELIVRGGEEK